MHKLQKIKRKDLDVEKYSKALNDSLNYRIYAEVWYLDILTDGKWECWISGDYEVIMPVPLQFKFGFKFVIMPIYCQQLGVFYKEEVSDELFREFESKIHKYRVRSYCFNEENTERYNPDGEKKVNHVLDLDLSYEEIRKNYNRNRRRKLIDLPESYEMKLSERTDDFFALYKKEYPNLTKDKWTEKLNIIMETSFKMKQGNQFRIENNDELIASLFYIKSQKRIYQLGASRRKDMVDIGLFTIIIDHVNKTFSNSGKMKFDFEGSSLTGVALFNESFGAEKKNYTLYKNFTFNSK